MITILFDIDGTLIHTRGAGMRAIGEVVRELFQLETPRDIVVHGRTDMGILSDVFGFHQRDFSEIRDQFNQAYWERLKETLGQSDGVLLPGVVDLLQGLQQRDDVALGLLTGNAQEAAWVKLRHFSLHQYFAFGGFGDLHADRNDVARLAVEAAAGHLGDRFCQERVWVVGDTVNDITCARSIGAKVVAVETGGADRTILADAEPDLLLSDLADEAAFLRAVFE